tara:strand:+ start:2752 stop:3375 length:624 start_codon:yes stop_codon:yes gene_type:complete
MTNKKTIQALFLFIFILLGKHISELLACSISNIINTHFIVKHIIGFFILYTTIISLETNKSLGELFINSFLIYIWFIITVKTTRRINISIIILLLITYFVYLYNEKLKQNKNDKNNKNLIKILDLYEKYIVYVLIILSVFGFIVYLGEKKLDFKENFSWKQFLFYRITDYSCNYTKSPIINKLNYFERAYVAFIHPNNIEQFIQKYQ